MEKIIKVGIGVLLIKNNQILLGHRIKDGVDTGGIYEPDTWCLPGGKQEYHETIFEGAIREVKEETNLNISQWCWFEIEKLPNNIYSPSKKFIEAYLDRSIT